MLRRKKPYGGSARGIAIDELSIVGRNIQVTEEPVGFVSTGDYVSAGARSGAVAGGLAGIALGAASWSCPGSVPSSSPARSRRRYLPASKAPSLASPSAHSAALIKWGVQGEHALKYESEVKEGKYLVIVKAWTGDVTRARSLLAPVAPERRGVRLENDLIDPAMPHLAIATLRAAKSRREPSISDWRCRPCGGTTLIQEEHISRTDVDCYRSKPRSSDATAPHEALVVDTIDRRTDCCGLVCVWVWAVRPPRIYSYWLGLADIQGTAPIRRLVAWAAWDDGPWTPSGLLALFEMGELIFAGLLLLPRSSSSCFCLHRGGLPPPQWRRLSAPVRSVQFQVRTALAALAIFGLYLGWEIHAWRTWQLRNDYLGEAAKSARGVESDLSNLRSMRDEPAEFRGRPPSDVNAPGPFAVR